ncbi:MAG: hypothetical protein PHD01_06205 [Geobacteraceae bacterium]|nr:hypothetical protein [Geobacteraceae bacterium]
MLLVPNVIQRPRKEIEAAITQIPLERRMAIETVLSTPLKVSPLDGASGVFVRFKEIKILDNHASFLGWDVSSDIYPIVLAVSDAAEKPFQISFASVFNDVHDGDSLPITNGLDFARISSRIPRFLDIHVVLMKSNEASRDIAKAVNEALSSQDGKNITATLGAAISGVNPIAGTIITIGTSVLSLITGYLSKEKDEQVFYGVTSFENDPDGLGVGKTWVLTDKKNASIIFEVIAQKS